MSWHTRGHALATASGWLAANRQAYQRLELQLTPPVYYSAGGGINTFNIADPAAIVSLQSQVFPAPADNLPSPQNQARPHQAVLDPTGEFLVFPDLGADLLRVFKVDKATLQYTEAVLTPTAIFSWASTN